MEESIDRKADIASDELVFQVVPKIDRTAEDICHRFDTFLLDKVRSGTRHMPHVPLVRHSRTLAPATHAAVRNACSLHALLLAGLAAERVRKDGFPDLIISAALSVDRRLLDRRLDQQRSRPSPSPDPHFRLPVRAQGEILDLAGGEHFFICARHSRRPLTQIIRDPARAARHGASRITAACR